VFGHREDKLILEYLATYVSLFQIDVVYRSAFLYPPNILLVIPKQLYDLSDTVGTRSVRTVSFKVHAAGLMDDEEKLRGTTVVVISPNHQS
jgi:hypothetical protein